MARNSRTKHSTFASLVDLIALLPWWVCTLAAVASFFYLRHLVQSGFSLAVAIGNSPQAAISAPLEGLVAAVLKVGQYVLPVLFLVSGGMSFLARSYRSNLMNQARVSRSLDGMTWLEFELLVGESFRQRGYTVKELGGAGPDGGIDLVLTKSGETFLVQCKQWKALKVGVDVVRQIFGVMAARGATGCFVVTSGQFTQAAVDFAKGRNIELVSGSELLSMIDGARNSSSPDGQREAREPTLEASATRPLCPVCGSKMVRRMSRKSPQNPTFLGCSSFPRCRGTRPDV